MTNDNPFGEGFDLNAMLEQAQQVQAELMRAQAELAATEVEGDAGGVTVKVSGTGELTSVRLAPGCVDANDPEDMNDLGDLIVAAFRNAKAKADQLAAQTLGPLGAGLDLADTPAEGIGGPAGV